MKFQIYNSFLPVLTFERIEKVNPNFGTKFLSVRRIQMTCTCFSCCSSFLVIVFLLLFSSNSGTFLFVENENNVIKVTDTCTSNCLTSSVEIEFPRPYAIDFSLVLSPRLDIDFIDLFTSRSNCKTPLIALFLFISVGSNITRLLRMLNICLVLFAFSTSAGHLRRSRHSDAKSASA